MAQLTAKKAAQGAMILAIKNPRDCHDVNKTNIKIPEDYQVMGKLQLTKEALYRVKETKGKPVLPQKEGLEYVTNLHYLTHFVPKNL